MTQMEKTPVAEIFRKEARDHLLHGEESPRRVNVSPPWSWALLWLLLAALGTALVLAVVGTVEVNSRAPGVLRPVTGVRVLTSQVAGTVVSVSVHSGDAISRGGVVLTIDTPPLQEELLEAQRQGNSLSQQDARQTTVLAPQDGVLEALLVRPGDAVRPGQAIGRLIPEHAPLQVISFLPEKDRAFVHAGSEVRLELDQLPYGEYGTLGARVLRIGDSTASPDDVRQALGSQRSLEAPAFRVVLAITDHAAARDAQLRLRSGMSMQVRYTLRRQRPITLVLKPLQKWLR